MISNPVPWPDGARCAVAFTLDMDAESLLYLSYPDKAHRMVATASLLRYGPEVALPRILDTYRHFGIRQTFFVPGWCAERYPHAVEAMVRDLSELKIGDPVVHVNHGIGRYHGLISMDLGEGETEFLHLEYAKETKLYVPVSQLHVISRYSGASPDDAPHVIATGGAFGPRFAWCR